LHSALEGWGPMSRLINETMRQAQAVGELGKVVFPDVETLIADQAVTALVALGSAAKRVAEDSGLLPCRVHAFFRGLPGLWACVDSDCSAKPQDGDGESPIGRLYAQPRSTCECGARVFEYYTCRHCGVSYARAYTNNVLDPTYLWNEPGTAFQSNGSTADELKPLDLLLETPGIGGDKYEVVELNLVTGALYPDGEPDRCTSPRNGPVRCRSATMTMQRLCTQTADSHRAVHAADCFSAPRPSKIIRRRAISRSRRLLAASSRCSRQALHRQTLHPCVGGKY
jgi:hypothetical protein